MEEITNVRLKQIIQDCKSTRFSKEPNLEKVVDTVAELFDIEPTENLREDVKKAFTDYKHIAKNNRRLVGSERSPEEEVCLWRKNYVKRSKTPTVDVSDRQQRRRLSDFIT